MGTAAEEETLAHFRIREPHLEAVVLTYKHMVNRDTLKSAILWDVMPRGPCKNRQ
jgi:hypothetical protein